MIPSLAQWVKIYGVATTVAQIQSLAWELPYAKGVTIKFFFSFCLFAISWAAQAAHGGSQARGRIGAVAAGLHQSHSNARSKPSLRSTPQLMAMPDP